MKRFCTTLCYLIIAISGFAQAVGDYRSAGNVDFTTTTNWQVLTALPATWAAAITAPALANLQSANTVTVLSGNQLSFSSNVNFASNNDFKILIQGTINTGSSVVASYGNGLSTVRIESNGNFTGSNVFRFHTFRKLELVGIGILRSFVFSQPLTVTNTLNTVNANLSVPSLVLSGNTVNINAAGNLNFGAAQTITNSTLTVNFSGTTNQLTYQNNLTMAGSQLNLNGNGAQLAVNGANFTMSASNINLSGNNQQLNVALSSSTSAISLSNTSFIKLLSGNGLMNLGINATFSAYSASNYVQLSPTSKVVRQIGNSETFTFPIGSSTYYLPLGVSVSTGGANNAVFSTGVFTGATLDGTPTGTPVDKSTIVDAVWTLSQDKNSTKNVTLTTSWPAALEGSIFAGFTTLSQVGISKGVAGSTTWAAAASGSNFINRSFTSNSITIPASTINSFVIGQLGLTLPIMLQKLIGNVIDHKVKLQWTALATSLSGYFEVERATQDGGKFQSIGSVKVQKVGDYIYTYTDEQPIQTTGYYRIRSIDENGHETLSKTIRININETPFMLNQLYPTVCRQNLNLSVNSSKADKLTVRIIDISGRLALEKHLQAGPGTNSYSLDLGRLASGQYVLVLNNGEQVITSRFIRQ